MRYIIQALFLCFLISCSGGVKSKPVDSNSEQEVLSTDLNLVLDSVLCPNTDDFRGTGISQNEGEALAQARSNMAQEHFVEKLKSSVDLGGQNINGVASTSTYTSISQNAKLLNPNDAKLHYSKRQGEQIGVVACMTKADAAKGFLERQRIVADSLELVSNTALSTEHPRHKNEAWQRTQMLYNDFMRIQNLLEGLGFKGTYSADEIYSKTRENYKNYCQNMKVFWQVAGDACSEEALAALSKKAKMERAGCSGGLRLSFNCPEKCKSSAYGIECSFEPSLSIESCGEESYSLLKVKAPVIANDIYSTGKAREKLLESLSDAVFFNEWEKEIKEWVPQCTD
jgi:hypothetical protein